MWTPNLTTGGRRSPPQMSQEGRAYKLNLRSSCHLVASRWHVKLWGVAKFVVPRKRDTKNSRWHCRQRRFWLCLIQKKVPKTGRDQTRVSVQSEWVKEKSKNTRSTENKHTTHWQTEGCKSGVTRHRWNQCGRHEEDMGNWEETKQVLPK